MRCLLAFLTLVLPCAASALSDWHDFSLNFRSRLADMEVDGNDGHAASSRIRANIQSQWTNNLTSTFELDYVASALKDEHSDGVRFNGKPVIPDAPGVDLNQAFFSFNIAGADTQVGRQTLSWDEERFIGHIAVWQNEQSFDALSLRYTTLNNFIFNYHYIANAHRIFGMDAGPALRSTDLNFAAEGGKRPLARRGRHRHNTHAIQLAYEGFDYHKFSWFFLDIENKTATRLSSATAGFRYQFNIKHGSWRYHTKLQYAIQDQDDHTKKLDYQHLTLGTGYGEISLFAQYERLDGDGIAAFTTSLATGHEHQGWADLFLTTPNQGIEDYSLRLLWRHSPWKLDIRYHRFYAVIDDAFNQNNHGDEIDFDISYQIDKQQNFSLRYARFMPNNSSNSALPEVQRVFGTYSLRFNF